MQNQLYLYNEKTKKLEDTIGYHFKNKEFIKLAITHSSYANEKGNGSLSSNERIEFLGDAVLSVIISELLYCQRTDLPEGDLTKMRASIVCEASLEKCAKKINLGRYLILGKGEELTGGRNRTSILSDAFEAITGAIYLDGGMNAAKDFITNFMGNLINESYSSLIFFDYKTTLQEKLQATGIADILYEIYKEEGPDHDKTYFAHIKALGKVMGKGKGRTKKEAEQKAAENAFQKNF